MPNFKVVLEIELQAETPLEAAKTARLWGIEDPMVFYTQNSETGEIHSVDLAEDDADAVLPVEKYTPIIK